MSMINPERIVFEDEMDLVDYVGRGMIPSKKNFEKFIVKVRNPSDGLGEGDISQVCVSKNMFLGDYNAESMDRLLTRMYENRVHNRNVMMAIGGILGGIVGTTIIRSKRKKKKEERIYEEETVMLD